MTLQKNDDQARTAQRIFLRVWPRLARRDSRTRRGCSAHTMSTQYAAIDLLPLFVTGFHADAALAHCCGSADVVNTEVQWTVSKRDRTFTAVAHSRAVRVTFITRTTSFTFDAIRASPRARVKRKHSRRKEMNVHNKRPNADSRKHSTVARKRFKSSIRARAASNPSHSRPRTLITRQSTLKRESDRQNKTKRERKCNISARQCASCADTFTNRVAWRRHRHVTHADEYVGRWHKSQRVSASDAASSTGNEVRDTSHTSSVRRKPRNDRDTSANVKRRQSTRRIIIAKRHSLIKHTSIAQPQTRSVRSRNLHIASSTRHTARCAQRSTQRSTLNALIDPSSITDEQHKQRFRVHYRKRINTRCVSTTKDFSYKNVRSKPAALALMQNFVRTRNLEYVNTQCDTRELSNHENRSAEDLSVTDATLSE